MLTDHDEARHYRTARSWCQPQDPDTARMNVTYLYTSRGTDKELRRVVGGGDGENRRASGRETGRKTGRGPRSVLPAKLRLSEVEHERALEVRGGLDDFDRPPCGLAAGHSERREGPERAGRGERARRRWGGGL